MPHVGGGQVAVVGVEVGADAGRDEIVPAVEVPHLHRRPGYALQGAPAREAVDVAGLQLPCEAQAEVVVDFLENHARAVLVFPQVALEPVDAARVGPRFPAEPAAALADQENREGAGGIRAGQDPVRGLVGEERLVRLYPPRAESPMASRVEPVIAIAHDVHEEWWQRVHPADPEIVRQRPAAPFQLGGGAGGRQPLPPEVDGQGWFRTVMRGWGVCGHGDLFLLIY